MVTGIILATSTVSFIAGYRSLVEQASVTHELQLQDASQKRLEATIPSVRWGEGEVTEADRRVGIIIDRNTNQEALDPQRYRESATFYLQKKEGDLGEHSRAFLVSLPDAVSHIRVKEGQNVGSVNREEHLGEIPVFLDAEVAELHQISVGESFDLIPYWDDIVEKITVRIIGLGELPRDTNVLWQEKLALAYKGENGYESIPMIVSDEILFNRLPRHLPQTTFDVSWYLPLDVSYAAPSNLLEVTEAFEKVRRELSVYVEGIRVQSVVPDLLRSIERKLFLAGVPIILIGVQVGVVAFIYVLAIGVMFWERQEKEFQLLIKRGARGWALLSVPISQIFLCVIAATVLGPIISFVFLMGLRLTKTFEMVSVGQIIGFAFGVETFGLALIVAAIGFVAMLGGLVVRYSVRTISTTYNTRTGIKTPVIFRYNLDIGLLIVIIPVLWELFGRRSIVTLSEDGQPHIALLAYALPIGISVVIGLLFLRVLPVLFSLAARLAGNTRNTVVYLGTISMSRGFTALQMGFLLLGASVAVLIFSLSLGESIESNMEERAFYDAGADIRIGIGRVTYFHEPHQLGDYIRNNSDVGQVSAVYRGTVSDISSYLGASFTMLGIDPATYAGVAWHRDDFFPDAESIPSEDLSDGELQGAPILLPVNTSKIAITVTPDSARPTMDLMARLRDGNGAVSNHSFGVLDFTETKQLEVDLAASLGGMEGQPYTLLSVYVHDQSTRWRSRPGTLFLDDLLAFVPENSSPVVLSSFDEPNVWGVTTYPLEGREVDFALAVSSKSDNNQHGVLAWQKASFFEIAGVSTISRSGPLKGWVSDLVTGSTGKSVGEVFIASVLGQTIPIEIVGELKYFPTVDTDERGLVVVDIGDLMARLVISAPDVHFLANEFWLSQQPEASDFDWVTFAEGAHPFRILSVIQSEGLLESSRVDPVVLGGWGVWVILASAVSFAFTLAGIVTVFVMQVDKLRNTFFVLKALGLSATKAYAAMVIDLTLICCMAVLLGAVLGNALQLIIVPMINVDIDGTQILPPVLATIDWLRSVYVCLGVLGLIVPLMAISQIWLTVFQKAQTLRLEEL